MLNIKKIHYLTKTLHSFKMPLTQAKGQSRKQTEHWKTLRNVCNIYKTLQRM